MNWKLLAIAVLLICLVASLSLNVYLISENSKNSLNNSHIATRVFYWRGRNYMVPSGVVCMEVSLNWVSNLTMTVIVNDDDYNEQDGLLLDVIDIGGHYYWLGVANTSGTGEYFGFAINGEPYLAFPCETPIPKSTYQTCTYNGTHYAFDIRLPVKFSSPGTVFMRFTDHDAESSWSEYYWKTKILGYTCQAYSVYIEFEV